LVSWWRAEGNAQDENGGNNGTLVSNVSYAQGEVGQGFLFSSNPCAVRLGAAVDLQLQTFTIEGWIRRSSPILVSLDPQGDGLVFAYGISSYGFGLHSSGQLFLSTIGYSTVQQSLAVTDTNFHHVAVSKSGTTVVFYLDGVASSSSAYSTTFTFTSAAAIGGRGDTLSNSFLGCIDELSIYKRALSLAEIQSIYNAKVTGKCPQIFPPAFYSQSGNQSLFVGTNITLQVAAGGSPPLSYQWIFDGNIVAQATNSTLVLTNLQTSQSGSYSVILTNAAGSLTNTNTVLVVSYPPAPVQVVSTNAASGGPAVVPVVITANGVENGVSFSLNFDKTLLTYSGFTQGSGDAGGSLFFNTNFLASGKLGVGLVLPFGTTLAAGTNELVRLNFTTTFGTNVVTPITFGDTPIARQITDTSYNSLAATYAQGSVTLLNIYEGDVSPRTNGDQSLTLSDWLEEGRFAAGLDTPLSGSEFQRADCAPRSSSGDGAVTVIDWVQVGRYAAAYDSLAPAGGPTSAIPGGSPSAPPSATRQLSAPGIALTQGATNSVTLSLILAAQGNENAAGFTMSFDPSAFTYRGAVAGGGLGGALLLVNSNLVASGKFAAALALTPGAVFPTGALELVKVTLGISPSALGNYSLALSNQVVKCEVSDALANALATTFVNGAISINPPPLINAGFSGQGMVLTWPLAASNFTLQFADSLPASNLWSNFVAPVSISNGLNTVFLYPTNTEVFFRLSHP
jgi:hypothetical protein